MDSGKSSLAFHLTSGFSIGRVTGIERRRLKQDSTRTPDRNAQRRGVEFWREIGIRRASGIQLRRERGNLDARCSLPRRTALQNSRGSNLCSLASALLNEPANPHPAWSVVHSGCGGKSRSGYQKSCARVCDLPHAGLPWILAGGVVACEGD